MRVPFPPAPPGRLNPRHLNGRLALLALAGLAAAWSAPVGRADTCSACPEPTLTDLEREAGFRRETRTDDDGEAHVDYVVTDGGECTYDPVAPPKVTVGKTWTVLRGAGTVFHCPWGNTSATVTITLSEGDSTEWKVEGEISAGVQGVLAKLGLTLTGSIGGAHTITEVRTLTQEIQAAAGHVLDWKGYFELADLTLDMQVAVTRRFAWWTKNEATDHEVHASGNVSMACGTEAVRLTRQASIGASFHIWDGSCDASVAPVDLGTFPRPKPEPVLTPPSQPTDEPLPPDSDGSEPAGDLPWPPESEPLEPPPPAPPAEPHDPSWPDESGDLDDPPAGSGPWPPEGDPSAQTLSAPAPTTTSQVGP